MSYNSNRRDDEFQPRFKSKSSRSFSADKRPRQQRERSTSSSYGERSNYSYNDTEQRSGYSRSYAPNNRFGGRSSNSGGRGGRRNGRASKQLDPALYIKEAVFVSQETVATLDSARAKFSEFQLLPIILDSLTARGYDTPTEIQAKTLEAALKGQDVVAVSQTGSGKTGAFLIPLLDITKRAVDDGKKFQTLIVAPTRELAFQIDKELHQFDLRRLGFWTQTCVGGTSMYDQMRNLRKTNQFIVGTPGRLVDLAKRGALDLSKINAVVLDEMDRMLEMGFVEDITWLLDQIPNKPQSLYFSATLDHNIRPILKKFSPEAVYVELEQPAPSSFVSQDVIKVSGMQSKLDALVDLLAKSEVVKSIVFVNTKQAAELVTDHLRNNNHRADYIHGGKTQSNRFRTLNIFKRETSAILVATDVAARGLDVHDISHVINFDEPQSYDDYIHRIGRTGRAGKYGQAYTFVVGR